MSWDTERPIAVAVIFQWVQKIHCHHSNILTERMALIQCASHKHDFRLYIESVTILMTNAYFAISYNFKNKNKCMEGNSGGNCNENNTYWLNSDCASMIFIQQVITALDRLVCIHERKQNWISDEFNTCPNSDEFNNLPKPKYGRIGLWNVIWGLELWHIRLSCCLQYWHSISGTGLSPSYSTSKPAAC